MSVKTIDIDKGSHDVAELATLAWTGTEVVLSGNGTPIAGIVPIYAVSTKRIAGLHEGAFEVGEDFDAPLPDDCLRN